MAAISIGHSFRTNNRNFSTQEFKSKNGPRTLNTVSCRTRLPIDPLSSETKKGKEKGKKLILLPQIFLGVENFGKSLKDSLSPKQKGDWKDLMLMSISFAVYVYISQKLVCAYCLWMSMVKQPW